MFEVRHEQKFLVFLFLFSLLVRGLVFGFYLRKNDNFWQIDSRAYHEIAKNIAQGKGILTESGQPNFHRLPGYPLFLAAGYKIFGANPKNVLWIQVVIASLIPLLIFFLALVLFPKRILLAKCVSVYSVFHLGLVLYSGFLITESLFIVLFLLFVLFFFSGFHLFFCNKVKSKRRRRWTFEESYLYGFCPEPACSGPAFVELTWNIKTPSATKLIPPSSNIIFFAGLFLGLASMVRPVGHYCVVLFALMLLFSNDVMVEKLRKIVLLIAGWFIVVLPWLLRNYVLLGHIFFHTLPGGHFLNLSAARVAMHVHNVSYWQAREILQKELAENIAKEEKQKNRQLSPIERCKSSEQLALRYFVSHPLWSLKYWLTDMMRASLSLYSAELVYLESGRKKIDYFKKGRGIWSLFERYLFPDVKSNLLRVIIWIEIILFAFVLIGFFGGLVRLIYCLIKRATSSLSTLCIWARLLPIMALFIVIALAGGYARMRLPIEPFLLILSFSFWEGLFR